VLNKLDTLEGAPGERGTPRAKAVSEFRRRLRWSGPTFEISALTGEGCEALCRAIWEHLDRHREPVPAEPEAGPAAPAPASSEPATPPSDPSDPRFRPVDPS
jgi:GTP-binding protein